MRALRWLCICCLIASCGDNLEGPAAKPQCSDGLDNDDDGTVDYPEDLGCSDEMDTSEDSQAAPQCSDGRDNDGDGKIDFPADPGCAVAQQDDENDDCPDGAGCPQCANGIDDDGNGAKDYPDDPGCTSAGDIDEFVNNPVACGAGLMIKNLPATSMDSGMLVPASTSTFTSCGAAAGAQAIAYVLHLQTPKVVIVTTSGSTADTVVDIRKADCANPAAEIACNNDVSGTDKSSKVTTSLLAGNYYIIVQGLTATTTGAYAIKVEYFTGENSPCTDTTECGPGLVCRTPLGQTVMVCSQPMCRDGVDDDGDGKLDFPTDPGCASLDDNDETDDCPTGPNCPACGNGVDDDVDGMTDYPGDTSCTAASGGSESCSGEQDPIGAIAVGMTMGTTVGAHDDHDPSCGSNNGVDVIYTLRLPAMQTVTIDTEQSSFDTLLSLLPTTCQEPGIECDDDDGTSTGASLITRTNVPAGNYIVAVDAYDATEVPGPFNVNVTGTISPGGACDASVTLGGALACPTMFPCEGTPLRCRLAQCNDGINNDADTKTDYPNDPGCTGPFDDDESDPCPGAGCPQCGDGLDNDSDGQTDYPNDTMCTAASGISESCPAEQDPLATIVATTTTGTLVGSHDDHNPTCGSDGGVDLLYQITVPTLATLTIDTEGTVVDTVVSLLTSTCQEPSITCDDDGGVSTGASLITRTNVAAGLYFLAIDAYSGTVTPDAFTLNVHGTLPPGASCEPAATLNGAFTCATNQACGGTVGSRTCRPPECSDGIDNNGTGGIDWPNDPGCASPNDAVEDTVVCPGAMCPACSNTADDDTDGTTDFPGDFGCSAAGATSEAFCPLDPDFGVLITMPTITGTTAAAAANMNQTCQANTGNDMTFALQLPVPVASLVLDTEGSTITDTVIGVRDASCSINFGCDDDAGTGNLSLLTLTNLPRGNYAVTVDGYQPTANNGAFTLNVHGTVVAGTACTSPLFTSGVLACSGAMTCTAGTCQ